ncbi:MAG TPA: sugar ABC transporter permease [Symbiobacteriaceae bacterium]|nr:sugar ABC transporter permease [Symbiobacteriaceae bacterium]
MAQLPTAPARTPKRKGAPRFSWGPYLLLLPSVGLLTLFTLWPMVSSLWSALFLSDLAHPEPEFAGLANFATLFADDHFRQALTNTVLFAIGTIPLTVALALLLATQLNRKLRSVSLLRAAFFYPTMLPLVSAATIWNFMYNPLYGPINLAVKAFGGEAQNFLGSSKLALLAIMFVSVWKDAGYFMLFYLAGMQNLPTDVYEAAELEGAGRWHQFRTITFPLLMPTTLFVATISFINAFKTVDQIFVMTGGGPDNSTSLLLYYIFEQTFAFFNKGIGAAASVVLILILLMAALFNHFVVDKKVHYE